MKEYNNCPLCNKILKKVIIYEHGNSYQCTGPALSGGRCHYYAIEFSTGEIVHKMIIGSFSIDTFKNCSRIYKDNKDEFKTKLIMQTTAIEPDLEENLLKKINLLLTFS